MAEYKNIDPETFSLIRETKEGRIQQIGLTEEGHKMLQVFLASISKEYKFVAMPEEFDLILKSSIDAPKP